MAVADTVAASAAPAVRHVRVKPQFDAVLRRPAVARSPHFALHRLDTGRLPAADATLFTGPGPWVGVLLPKRWARRAVTRNTLRRQIYAVASALAPQWPDGTAVVVRLHQAYARDQFISATSVALRRAVRAELLSLLAIPLRGRA